MLRNRNTITYTSLVDFRRRGLRNGNWMKLDTVQKGLFRCALWVARVRGKISNTKLMVQVIAIASKLVETVRNTILRAGRKRVATMRDAYAKPDGVFDWAPQVSRWLNESGYVWYLGLLELNLMNGNRI